MTEQEFVRKLDELYKGEYSLIDDFYKLSFNVKLRHTCGREFETKAGNVIREPNKKYCPSCRLKSMRKAKRKSQNEFRQEIYNIVGEDYSVSQKFVNSAYKIAMTHNVCGNKFKVAPRSFTAGSRCPFCTKNKSRGEKLIEEYLLKNNFEFRTQYTFKECKNISSLPFDFAIFKNKVLVCLIEFDGKQHFEPVEIFGGEDAFNKTKKNDIIKNSYCAKNRLDLVRIPYQGFNNINKILDSLFKVEYHNLFKENYKHSNKRNRNLKEVVQLTLDGEYIKTYSNMKEITEYMGIAHSSISQCCRGNIKTSGGFKWIYLEDYEKSPSMSKEWIMEVE
ncbi:NUMOD1 domain-containing DNA-binding protein [Psychrobacillus sp. L3]|uniref:NUMOD1 domain-containing DNA-binding protein n=1 Tax=Psychrobacillus sp. L3 TaxID=3236891 RepID=UPI0036F1E98C